MDSNRKPKTTLDRHEQDSAELFAAGRELGARIGFIDSHSEVHHFGVALQCWSGNRGLTVHWEYRESWLMIDLVRAPKFPADGYMPFTVQKRLDSSQFDVPLTREQQKLLKRLNRMLSLPKAGRFLRENLEMITELLNSLQAESPLLSGPLPPPAERRQNVELD